MSTEDFVNWGPDAARAPLAGLGPASAARPLSGAATDTGRSLLRARMNAVILDFLVLLVPLGLADVAMGAVFPDQGFYSGTSGAGGFAARVGPSGALLMVALWLSYFTLSESLTGQTIGKRWQGLRVVSVDGGPAGVGAVATRSLLRLVDDLAICLVGLLVMILSGERRRRLGDLAGRTVVVGVESTAAAPPRPGLRAGIYPVVWLATVMVVVFGLGLGSAAGAGRRAIALVRSYENARASGNAPLACSLLARDQQRELVARATRDYRHAAAAACPSFVLVSSSVSSTLDANLAAMAAGPLIARPTSGGGIHVISPVYPNISLYAINENGRTVLDARGLQKLSFLHSCTGGAARCFCLYEWLRAQAINPYGYSPYTRAEINRSVRADGARCQAAPTGFPN